MMGDLFSSLKKRLISSVNPFTYEQSITDTAKRFLTGSGEMDDEYISTLVSQIYPSAIKSGSMKPWEKGDLAKGRNVPIRVAERMDMVNLAAGLQQKFGSLGVSKYRPTKGADEGDVFYSFKDKNQMKKTFTAMVPFIDKMKKGKTYNVTYSKEVKGKEDIRRGGSKIPSSSLVGGSNFLGLERFQVSLGEDKKGKYLSVYDKWDIDKWKWAGSQKAFEGFNFYDRIYYDVPEPKIRRAKTGKVGMKKAPKKRKRSIEDKIMGFFTRTN